MHWAPSTAPSVSQSVNGYMFSAPQVLITYSGRQVGRYALNHSGQPGMPQLPPPTEAQLPGVLHLQLGKKGLCQAQW